MRARACATLTRGLKRAARAHLGDKKTMTRSRFQVLPLLLASALFTSGAHAGDLADVKAKGKLIMLTFPAVEDPFVAVNLDAMRTAGLKLADK